MDSDDSGDFDRTARWYRHAKQDQDGVVMGEACSLTESPLVQVRIVASCTQGKRLPVPPDLRLGSISNPSLDCRLVVWKDRLQRSGAGSVAAVDLYRGQHWAVVRELPAVAQAVGCQAGLWVASAGYGLVPAAAQVRPYSATFASSEADSVWRPGDGYRLTVLRAWWSGLQEMPGPAPGAPRSLKALAGMAPDAVLLVIASPAYIAAMADDLAEACACLTDPQRLIVISRRANSLPEWLKPHVVPSEAPLSGVLGGSRGSLHARTARRVLQEAATVPLRAEVLGPHYERLLSTMESVTAPARVKLADDDVRRFIREAIAGNQGLACSAALRSLRKAGQACEQRRFGGLYTAVRREADVS